MAITSTEDAAAGMCRPSRTDAPKTPVARASAGASEARAILATAESRGVRAALRQIVSALRPVEGRDAAFNIRRLREALEGDDPRVVARLRTVVREGLGGVHLHPGVVDSGIGAGEGFVTETLARLGRRLLPRRRDPNDVRDLLLHLFDEPDDHAWVSTVPPEEWGGLLTTLGIQLETDERTGDELSEAIRSLTHHAASLGLRPQVAGRLPNGPEGRSPFLPLGDVVLAYLDGRTTSPGSAAKLEDALDRVAACRAAVERLREEKSVHGTSVWLTSVSGQLVALLERLDRLLRLRGTDPKDRARSSGRLLTTVLQAEQTRDDLLPHLRASADLLVYQIVEHAARKGSKYITTGRSDYARFFLSSLGGGFVVALFAFAKVVMSRWELPLGVEALLYGINYSVCFVLIYLTGATLATKQPAMTANTLARSLGEKGHDLEALQRLIVRVWRSQFISFVGNLAMALPVAFALSWLGLTLTGMSLVEPDRASTMLQDLHPWRSGTLAYAAIAGVLLFGAGLVSGWVDNGVVHRDLQERIAGQPRLRALLGPARAERFAATLDRNLGAVAGNVFLGFGLGSLGSIGAILGLPLDIRHIAFASAELGVSLDVLGQGVAPGLLVEVALGIAAIGLLNFVVSFGLSLGVALESRGVGFGESRELSRGLARRLRSRPLDWFFPPRRSE